MTPRDESIAWVSRALQHEQPQLAGDELQQHAEGLIAIAEENGIRIEDLVVWIHCATPGKEWSLGEFRRFAGKLQQIRKDVAAGEPL